METVFVANLKNIKENKNRTRPNLKIEEIYEYDLDSTYEELEEYCKKADFVFNFLAGVNRTGKSRRIYVKRKLWICIGFIKFIKEI